MPPPATAPPPPLLSPGPPAARPHAATATATTARPCRRLTHRAAATPRSRRRGERAAARRLCCSARRTTPTPGGGRRTSAPRSPSGSTPPSAMEDRVQAMLKLIGADGDSFGKKAELYFKSRPELINHVEEMFRSYQALADRFDRLSSELHRANHTIATVFPDQVQFSMQDGDGEMFPKTISGVDLSNFKFPSLEGLPAGSRGASRGTSPVPKWGTQAHRRVTSQMSKEKAQEEIDKLQKQILVLQTEKEFLKTSYDSTLGRYLDIEKQVAELQDEVCSLQDAFSTGAAIEDNEARALMAARAFVSCEDTLVNLQDQQKTSVVEAKVEFRRANEAMEKLKNFKDECGVAHAQMDGHDHHDTELGHGQPFEDIDDLTPNEGRLDLQEICQKVKELFELHPEPSVAELADKVDRLVEKVVDLELATISQNAQISRMRTEIDDLHQRLHALEEDKATLVVDASNLADRLKQVEEMLQAVQQIGTSIQNGTEDICKQMTEASHELTDFVETLNSPEPQITDIVESSETSKSSVSPECDSGLATLSVKKEPSDSLVGTTSEVQKHGKGLEDPVVQQQLVPECDSGLATLSVKKEPSNSLVGTTSEVEKHGGGLEEPVLQRQLVPECHSGLATLSVKKETSTSLVGTTSEVEKHGEGLEDPVVQQQLVSECDSGLATLSVKKEPSDSLVGTTSAAEEHGEGLEEPVVLVPNDPESEEKILLQVEKHDQSLEDPAVPEQLVPNEPEGEEKIRLQDCASVLQNYKDTEQKLSEIEKRNQENHLEAMSELKELKNANATKDVEIHSLRRMLSSLQKKRSASVTDSTEKSEETSKISTGPVTEDKEVAEIEEYIKQCQVEDTLACSAAEKFRAEIDRVLGENLDFWLRFSTSYHQIRNFQASFGNLKAEMDKLTDEQAQGGAYGFAANYQVAKLESAVLEKKFRDLNTDLQVWMEKNVLLKGEVENRFSSLCGIQEEISKITLVKSEEVHFNPFQAAKFQGEVLNMKQENNKISKELEAGLDHVRGLQVEVGRVLLKLRENLELSIARSNRAQQNFRNLSTKAGVPLRTFLFGPKPKKPSLFSCMGPGVHKHHGCSKSGRR
ncbi:hypothetical protein ACP4OV_028809 [Aristida adscensionis]